VSYGLPPRPELSEGELAALIAAAEEVLKTVSNVVVDQAPSWRFSGRWFNDGPYSMRRPQRSS
jgi:hypothetical protein